MSEPAGVSGLCRDCFRPLSGAPKRCPACNSPRLRLHPELLTLTTAHLDCDAFYASVEKRDNPDLRDKPVIVGGGRRGVVSTACYVARLYGVRSAMPMFKALRACPNAVVIRPDMAKYVAVSKEVKRLMLETTPMVEPLSLDEAFLDLAGTERLHRHSAAETLMRLSLRVENELGVTVSIGLSYNKFLAKLGSEVDKPRGFAVIGRADAKANLASRPVSAIWGVGKAMQARLERDGLQSIAQLQDLSEDLLVSRYGSIGQRLFNFSRGIDDRIVDPEGEAKSISAETTFEQDMDEADDLEIVLWPLCEKVSRRLKRAELAAKTLTLKLKTSDFKIVTRSHSLSEPTQLAEVIFREAQPMLRREATGKSYRLLGIGASAFASASAADHPTLLEPDRLRKVDIERAIDKLRAKYGEDAVGKGRGFRKPK